MHSPNLIGFSTMVRKEWVRIWRIWSQTLLPPVVTMSLYFLIFGGFIGSQVEDIEGYSYMQFIVPGLVMMTIITSSYMNSVSTFFLAKWMRTINEYLVSPMSHYALLAGFVAGGLMRGFLSGVLVIVVSLFFTHLTIFNVGILFAAALLTSLIFSLAGVLNGIFAKTMDSISLVPNFVLTPLTYLGGIFYSVTLLPPLFRDLSYANPILYMVNAFRYGFLGISDVALSHAFIMMGGLVVVLTVVILLLLSRGIGTRM